MNKFLIKFFLRLNRLFKPMPHPFNEDGIGENLNYAPYEFATAPNLFKRYDRFGLFFEKVRGKKVADFACGGGGKTIFLAMNGPAEVWGIDLNAEFIAQANSMAKEKGVSDKCYFSVDDATSSSLPDSYFDFVIFNDAIEHIPNTKKALLEALRILKPGGEIYINFEGYYFVYGHHLWDALMIPWLHVFTTEKFRIALYKEAIKKYPNGDRRVSFRISRDERGREHISYLNRITIRKFFKVVTKLEKSGAASIKHVHLSTFNKPLFKALARIPLLKELFLSTTYCVLKKPL